MSLDMADDADEENPVSKTISSTNPGKNDNISNVSKVRRYKLDQSGPWIVYIRSGDGKPLKQVTLSKLIYSRLPKGITRIEQVNAFKLRVTCSDAASANVLVESKFLGTCRLYVPAAEVETDGVVRLSVAEDVNDLVLYGRGVFDAPGVPDVQIVSAFRMKRRTGGESQSVNVDDVEMSEAVRVTFSGKLLPDRVVLFGLRMPVRVYRPMEMFCDKCLRTGHTQRFCDNAERCAKCSGQHLTTACSAEGILPTCVVCKGDHAGGRSACPVIVSANKRKLDLAKKRHFSSYAKAVKEIETQNSFDILSDSDDDVVVSEEQFPSLSSRGRKRRRLKETRGVHGGSSMKTVGQKFSTGEIKVATPSVSKDTTDSTTNNTGEREPKTKTKRSGQTSCSHILKIMLNQILTCLGLPKEWNAYFDKMIQSFTTFILPLLQSLITDMLGSNGSQ